MSSFFGVHCGHCRHKLFIAPRLDFNEDNGSIPITHDQVQFPAGEREVPSQRSQPLSFKKHLGFVLAPTTQSRGIGEQFLSQPRHDCETA